MGDSAEDRAKAAKLPEGDLVRILLEQHAAVKDLFADIEAASGAKRATLFEQLVAMLKAHETAEEAVVRPVAAQTAGEDEAAERNAEEAEADAAVAALLELDVDSAEFAERFVAFKEAVDAHAEAEETEEFSTLQSQLDAAKLQDLGQEFLEKFAAAGGVG
ncbi:MAG TPA: hemerythrin domain-containing protein [Acidothermaceae bacterium]|jgi:hemerythrin superfamily protein